jgi:predicted Holliday junction resolvase-like endonuclease
VIQTIFILIGINILVGSISFLVIRKLSNDKKSLEFKLDYADRQIDFLQKNRQAFQAVMDKTMENVKDAEKLKEKINNSTGDDLSDILNSL